jgi:hypothetical protein
MPTSREELLREQSGEADKPLDDGVTDAAGAVIDTEEDAALAEQAKERPQG